MRGLRAAPAVVAAAALLVACSAGSGRVARPAPSGATSGASSGASAPPNRSTPSSRSVPANLGRPVLEGATIGIDPGHNGLNHTRPDVINRLIGNGRGDDLETCNTTGTETDDGYPESAYNFAVATFLARSLRARGATVVLTRHSDDGVGPCVDRRAEILNRAQADVAIDIHADGGPSWGRGFAILEPVASGTNNAVVPASLRYARALRREFLRTRMPLSTYDGEHGLQERTDLGGLNLTTVPQLLIECGNMRNATDAGLLRSPRFQRAASRAILRAMRDFLISEQRRSEAQSSR